MYIFVLPVSGGGFVTQLAILQHLCISNIKPTITLASSGGNVAAYIAAAAKWKWAAIERIARELSPDLFASMWNQVSILSNVIGYYQGNMHNRGKGVNEFLSRYFTPKLIVKYEIWTGTYNKDRKQVRLFCNKNENDSIMDVSCIDHDLTQSMSVVFANGSIDLIGKVSSASASIPAIVPAQHILNEYYVDGGVAGASPLTIMEEPILKYVNDNGTSMHIIYINSVDLSNHNNKLLNNIIDTVKEVTGNMVRASTVNDRLAGYKLLRYYPGLMNKENFVCTYENLERIKFVQTKIKYSMLEIYPHVESQINIINFTGEEIVKAIHEVYDKCRCRFWWLSSDELCPNEEDLEISHIIKLCQL